MKCQGAGGASSVLGGRGERIIERGRGALRATFLFVVPTLVICTLTLEGGLRLLGRVPSNTTEGIFQQRGVSYGLRHGITKRTSTPSFTYTIHTDPEGHRSRAPGVPTFGSRPYRAFIGDSITFANGVSFEESFVGVFGEAAARRDQDVVNLAVGGHRFPDQVRALDELLTGASRTPTQVVVIFTAYFVWGFEQRDRSIVVRNGHLFGADSWRLPYLRVLLGEASSAYCLFRDGVRRLQERAFSAPSAGFPESLEIFSRDAPLARPEVAARFERYLDAFDARVRGAGSEPVYVYMPNSVDLAADEALGRAGRRPERYDFGLYRDLLAHHSERAGIRFVDLLPLLRQRRESGATLSFFLDPHYEAGTNRVIGDALARALLGDALPAAPAAAGAVAERL